MKKKKSTTLKNQRAQKIEILEKLAVKLRDNGLLAEAQSVENSINVLKEIDAFDSTSHSQNNVEDAKEYISSVSNFIRENSRIDEEILATRFI